MEDILYKIFESLPRQGPGDRESTRRAFQACTELPENPAILDVGCGVGMQTADLAGLAQGTIIAVDNHLPFVETLRSKSRKKKHLALIYGVAGDMASLCFRDESFDIVWSEGASYIIGFEKALKSWKSLLKPGGYMAISEVAWFRNNPPEEAVSFWEEEYPFIKNHEDNCRTVETAGYEMIDSFALPGESWWTNYYGPLEKKVAQMRQACESDDELTAMFDALQREIDTHRNCSEYYGYGFYIMRKKR